MKRILVTGAGGSPATNFVRSLRQAPEPFYLVGTDADRYCLHRAETDRKVLVPPASDPLYLDVLNHVIDVEQIDLVHAQNDVEASFLSEHRDELHAATFLPSRETMRLCQDKFESFERWKAAGITVPETVLLHDEGDLAAAMERFGGQVWLRAIQGAGGKGSLPVQELATAKAWVDFHQGWGTFTASELLEPESVTWMSIWHHGELVVAQARKRLYWELSRIAPSGITGVTGAGVTISSEELDDLSVRTIHAIDDEPHGLFGVDLTYDRAGRPNPTEINIGRFFTTHQFFTELGLNMPYIYTKLACGEPAPAVERRFSPLPESMVWIRGVDFEPVLVTEADIDAPVRELDELRRTLGRA